MATASPIVSNEDRPREREQIRTAVLHAIAKGIVEGRIIATLDPKTGEVMLAKAKGQDN